jgi:hypothetical protein
MAKSQGSKKQSTGETGTRDVTFNLVSVLYHALQGAETINMYVDDANTENEELAEFFEETKADYERIAEQAKELLAMEMGGLEMSDDDDMEMSDSASA